MTQIIVGLIAEGATDRRFFKPILEKSLSDIAFDCRGQVDIEVVDIRCDKGNTFADFVNNASEKGNQEYGITILIVHSDADSQNAENTYHNKILPAKEKLERQPDATHCKRMAALVPVHETEAWMLADKALLIKQIGTNKSEAELNINGNPETFTNPKERIKEAIRIGREGLPRKIRNALSIDDLYDYLGGAIRIEKLKTFRAYRDFERNIREELVKLNYLNPQN